MIAYELGRVSIVAVPLSTGEYALLAICATEQIAYDIMGKLEDWYPDVVEMPGELEAGSRLLRADPSRARSLEEIRTMLNDTPTRPR